MKKCERCEQEESTLECSQCGDVEGPMFLCLECSKLIHKGRFACHKPTSRQLKEKEQKAVDQLTEHMKYLMLRVQELHEVKAEMHTIRQAFDRQLYQSTHKLQEMLKQTAKNLRAEAQQKYNERMENLSQSEELIKTKLEEMKEFGVKLKEQIERGDEGAEEAIKDLEAKYQSVTQLCKQLPTVYFEYHLDFKKIEEECQNLRIEVEESAVPGLLPDFMTLPALDIHNDKVMELYVSCPLQAAGTFWIQNLPADDNVYRVLNAMHFYIRSNYIYGLEMETGAERGEMPEVGAFVYAKYDKDKKWYRAKVDYYRQDKAAVQVMLLDYGNIITVPYNNVIPVSEDLFTNCAFQSVECSIFEEKLEKPIPYAGKHTFNRLVMDDTVKCTFKHQVELDGRQVWYVELTALDGEGGVCSVNDLTHAAVKEAHVKGQASITCRDIRLKENPNLAVHSYNAMASPKEETASVTIQPNESDPAAPPGSEEKEQTDSCGGGEVIQGKGPGCEKGGEEGVVETGERVRQASDLDMDSGISEEVGILELSALSNKDDNHTEVTGEQSEAFAGEPPLQDQDANHAFGSDIPEDLRVSTTKDDMNIEVFDGDIEVTTGIYDDDATGETPRLSDGQDGAESHRDSGESPTECVVIDSTSTTKDNESDPNTQEDDSKLVYQDRPSQNSVDSSPQPRFAKVAPSASSTPLVMAGQSVSGSGSIQDNAATPDRASSQSNTATPDRASSLNNIATPDGALSQAYTATPNKESSKDNLSTPVRAPLPDFPEEAMENGVKMYLPPTPTRILTNPLVVNEHLGDEKDVYDKGDAVPFTISRDGNGTEMFEGTPSEQSKNIAVSGEFCVPSEECKNPCDESEPPSDHYLTKLEPSGEHHQPPLEPSGEHQQVPSEPSGEHHQVTSEPSGEHQQVPSQPSSEHQQLPSEPSGEYHHLQAEPSGEHHHLQAEPSGEHYHLPSEPSGEHHHLPSEPSGEHYHLPSEPSGEYHHLQAEPSGEHYHLPSEPSGEHHHHQAEPSSSHQQHLSKSSIECHQLPFEATAEHKRPTPTEPSAVFCQQISAESFNEFHHTSEPSSENKRYQPIGSESSHQQQQVLASEASCVSLQQLSSESHPEVERDSAMALDSRKEAPRKEARGRGATLAFKRDNSSDRSKSAVSVGRGIHSVQKWNKSSSGQPGPVVGPAVSANGEAEVEEFRKISGRKEIQDRVTATPPRQLPGYIATPPQIATPPMVATPPHAPHLTHLSQDLSQTAVTPPKHGLPPANIEDSPLPQHQNFEGGRYQVRVVSDLTDMGVCVVRMALSDSKQATFDKFMQQVQDVAKLCVEVENPEPHGQYLAKPDKSEQWERAKFWHMSPDAKKGIARGLDSGKEFKVTLPRGLRGMPSDRLLKLHPFQAKWCSLQSAEYQYFNDVAKKLFQKITANKILQLEVVLDVNPVYGIDMYAKLIDTSAIVEQSVYQCINEVIYKQVPSKPPQDFVMQPPLMQHPEVPLLPVPQQTQERPRNQPPTQPHRPYLPQHHNSEYSGVMMTGQQYGQQMAVPVQMMRPPPHQMTALMQPHRVAATLNLPTSSTSQYVASMGQNVSAPVRQPLADYNPEQALAQAQELLNRGLLTCYPTDTNNPQPNFNMEPQMIEKMLQSYVIIENQANDGAPPTGVNMLPEQPNIKVKVSEQSMMQGIRPLNKVPCQQSMVRAAHDEMPPPPMRAAPFRVPSPPSASGHVRRQGQAVDRQSPGLYGVSKEASAGDYADHHAKHCDMRREESHSPKSFSSSSSYGDNRSQGKHIGHHGFDKPSVQCFNCSDFGHYSKACPKKAAQHGQVGHRGGRDNRGGRRHGGGGQRDLRSSTNRSGYSDNRMSASRSGYSDDRMSTNRRQSAASGGGGINMESTEEW